MRPFSRRTSISARLMRMNLLVTAVALSLASVSFLLYDAYSFRQNLIHSLHTEAQIIGANSASALLFDDSDAAHSTLSALRNSPDVVYAIILTPARTPLANYQRQKDTPKIDTPPLPGHASEFTWQRGSQILLGSRIDFQGKNIGTVYILAETTEIGQRIRRYVLIAILILLVCLVAALMLTASFRRVIANPIVGLANIARTVTREKDFSIRAPIPGDTDEVSVLVNSFNEMLGQIQERDRALLASRDELEQRVQERTAELQAANKELEAFSYSVAHDLRGPLDSIGSTSFLLRNADWSALDPQLRGQTAEILEMLPRAIGRMSALIDDLLNLSRSKSAVLHLEPIDLSAMAAGILDELAKNEPNRKVDVVIAPRVVAIADKGLMRVVLANLLGNAWKYTSKTPLPHIEFGTRREGNNLVYFVCDNGAGFDPQYQHRLFQPFQRLHATSEFAGTGIGLATVHRIVTRHGGRIWAESQLDHGADFFFTLN